MIKPLRDIPFCTDYDIINARYVLLTFKIPGISEPIIRHILWEGYDSDIQRELEEFTEQWREDLYSLLEISQYTQWLKQKREEHEILTE